MLLAALFFARCAQAAAIFGDVRDRLGCQLPGHTLYPFCNSSLPTKDRVADLIPRIPNELKPGLLTARAVVAIPSIGVPSYYWCVLTCLFKI